MRRYSTKPIDAAMKGSLRLLFRRRAVKRNHFHRRIQLFSWGTVFLALACILFIVIK